MSLVSICPGGGQISYSQRYVPHRLHQRASHSYPFFPISVVDILKNPNAPHVLVSHRLISLSLSHTWTCGRALIPDNSLFRRSLLRLRSVLTQRSVEPTLFNQSPSHTPQI